MIVSRLFEYIKQNGTVGQAQLAQHFGISADGVDAMLAIWISKGKLTRLVDTSPVSQEQRVRYAITQRGGLSLTVEM
ncbi:FeoC-like transcriptional regulator [Vibrio astriarenae]|jgi:putative ferrous iron transport protein C